MFSEMKKQAEESRKRWDEIKQLSEELEDLIKPVGSIEDVSNCTARLVLLLVKQFQPMNILDSKALEDNLKELLGSLTGGTTGGKKDDE